jgi:hypothetical protein
LNIIKEMNPERPIILLKTTAVIDEEESVVAE